MWINTRYYFFFFSLQGSATIKEPFAFRKVRHKQGHATSQSCLASSGSDDSAIITPAELDFIPLDRDYGEYIQPHDHE